MSISVTSKVFQVKKDQKIKLLITQLNEGNELAFDSLYKHFAHRVFAFALSLSRNRIEAEDVVQEVFLKVWNKKGGISVSGSFESYLFTICKNSLLNSIRKKEYHRTFIEYKRTHSGSIPTLDDELNGRELEELYQKAIHTLSPRKKEVFVLSQKHALSYLEIAQRLGISVKTVRNQMDAASKDIQHAIARFGITLILIISFFVK